jgi:hypothetical protein
MGEIVGGTVTQRSFVGREAANIVHIATVPVSELGIDSDKPEIILAEVLGIPVSSILDDNNYRQVIELLRGFPPDYFSPYWHPSIRRYFNRLFVSFQKESDAKELFIDFLATVGTPSLVANVFQPWPFFAEPEFRDKVEVSQEVLVTAMQCIFSRSMRSHQTDSFIREVFSYDIPMGQSPSVKSDSLLKLLETSRKFCIAPLALGGAQAVTQLTQGNYVAALLTTGTAGVMTLVLIGTVSVGALIVQKVAQARAKRSYDDGGGLTNRSTRTRKKPRAG